MSKRYATGLSTLALGAALWSGPAAYADDAAIDTAVNTSSHERRMENIVVTAAGYQQTVVEAPASITLLPRETLEQQRVNTLAEALRGFLQVGPTRSPTTA